jgi:hypothetical protein
MFNQITLKCRRFEDLIKITRNSKNLFKKVHQISLKNSPPHKLGSKLLFGEIFGGLLKKDFMNFS